MVGDGLVRATEAELEAEAFGSTGTVLMTGSVASFTTAGGDVVVVADDILIAAFVDGLLTTALDSGFESGCFVAATCCVGDLL